MKIKLNLNLLNMIKNLRFLLFLLLSSSVFSQGLECGTTDISYFENREMIRETNLIKSRANYRAMSGVLYVPIQMNIVGNDDGSESLSEDALNDGLAELNKQFKQINIQFYFKGTEFKYYRNSLINNGTAPHNDYLAFARANSVNDAMNLTSSRVVKGSSNGNVGGWSYVAPNRQIYNLTWINNSQFNDDKTTPHEFGHYFGLNHTFHEYDHSDVSRRELVTRNPNEVNGRISANCSTTGDYICDTPSDPYIGVSNCLYTGTGRDANNDLFTPLVNNYMDYNWCRPYTFTQGQIDRMQNVGLINILSASDFNFSAPETQQLPPSNLNFTRNTSGYGYILNWTDNSNVETGYIIEAKKGNGEFIPIKGVKANTVSVNLNDNLEVGSEYVFRIKATNTKENYSSVSAPLVMPLLCANGNENSCQVYAQGDTSARSLIENVKLYKTNGEVIFQNLNSNCSINGIGNFYNSHSGVVSPGDHLKLLIQSKYNAIANTAFRVNIKVFIDWNNDDVFDETTELFFQEENAWRGIDKAITIPNNIPDGSYRLRIALSNSGGIDAVSACRVSGGEIEDYRLIVKDPANMDRQSSGEFKISIIKED